MPDIRGVDVASFQGTPNQWMHDPGAQGIQWAAVKFTEVYLDPEGRLQVYENPDAKADWDWLWWQEHHEGRPMGRVAYLFAHPNVSVHATVAAFKAMCDRLGLLDNDGIAFDLEVSDGMSPAAVSSWARELEAELAAAFGRRIILYSFYNFINDGFCAGSQNCLLWIASITTPGLPQIPHPFKDWFAQQYGQAGPIDQDVAHYSTLAAMRAAMGRPQVHQQVAVHVTTGEESMVGLSHLVRCEISVMLELTLLASANSQFLPALAGYLDTGNLQAPIPKGVPVRFLESVRS